MTQLIDAEVLHDWSAFRTQSPQLTIRLVPVLRWTIDRATGRAVGNWMLAARQLVTSLCAQG